MPHPMLPAVGLPPCLCPLCSSLTDAQPPSLNPLSRKPSCPFVTPSSSFGAAAALSPTPLSPRLQLQRQLDSLTQCLMAKVPADAMYPSLGQVGEEARRISTFLDLYHSRARVQDDASLLNNVKSPTSREGGVVAGPEGWAPLNVSRRRAAELRRSRSLEHMKPFAIASDIVRYSAEMEDALPAQPPAAKLVAPNDTTTTTAGGSLQGAKAAIVSSDAMRMASFRKKLKTRPPPLQLPSILPQILSPPLSPPVPSALLNVKSPKPVVTIAAVAAATRRLPRPPLPHLAPRRLPPRPVIVAAPTRAPSLRAPYWVKKVPKTPRTMRTERRQGWSGSWDMAGISQVVHQLQNELDARPES
ncbi:hypothetical protein BC835DRAFT_853664 [Cytidiella melzeri]|nr:hypothetical protein BC835DRAFT_853664 [Cytidiella melzeri]